MPKIEITRVQPIKNPLVFNVSFSETEAREIVKAYPKGGASSESFNIIIEVMRKALKDEGLI